MYMLQCFGPPSPSTRVCHGNISSVHTASPPVRKKWTNAVAWVKMWAVKGSLKSLSSLLSNKWLTSTTVLCNSSVEVHQVHAAEKQKGQRYATGSTTNIAPATIDKIALQTVLKSAKLIFWGIHLVAFSKFRHTG